MNGTTPKKVGNPNSVNGHSPTTVNGSASSHTNGSLKSLLPVRSQLYHGHKREEVTRILIQGLLDMGYSIAAQSLTQESGYELESTGVAAFRNAVQEGHWAEAENILLGSSQNETRNGHDSASEHGYGEGLVLAESANKSQMLFWLRQQKFLELLEQRELGLALMVLRQEITPLRPDTHQLHTLSRYSQYC